VAARLSTLTPDPVQARQLLQGAIGQFVTQQALTQAFQDVFLLIAGLFAAMLVIVPLCRTAIFSDAAPVEAH
jgi:DHA2 family multidrug resistance protein